MTDYAEGKPVPDPLPTGAATEAKQDSAITELQAIKAAAQILDDWDESDRAKTNPIVGQAGVSAGAGAVDATTQRTTLASDDPAVSSLSSLDGKFTSLDAGGRQPVTAHNSIGLDVSAGLIFTAGDEIVLGAGQDGSLAIENPAASGKTLVILSFSVYHGVADSLDIVFFEDPTVTGGTTLTPFNHNFASADTSSMVVTSGQGILSGGTELHAHVRAGRDAPFTFSGAPIIVAPGTTLGLQMQAPGGLGGGTDMSVNVTYKEQ